MILWCNGLVKRCARKSEGRKQVQSNDVGLESELTETRPSETEEQRR